MIASRLSGTIFTAPMFFVGFGVLMANWGYAEGETAEHALHLVAEIALVVLLFLDASQINFAKLRGHHAWPQRMLLIGLPLAVLFGVGAAYPFLPGWPLAAIALVAAILAPTDAALGQAVVTNKAVPEPARRSLTVESGLNDGMSLPIILLFTCMVAGLGGEAGSEEMNWLAFAAGQITLGPAAGIVIGLIGGKFLVFAQDRGWTSEVFEGIASLALAGLAYTAATKIGGNGFISSFVAGLVFGNIVKDKCQFIFEFAESEGQILIWGAFFLLGLALVPEAVEHLTPEILGLILVSLFIVRPLAIWISLIGSDARTHTRLFFGWFGPRGLATALFALLVVPEVGHEFAEPVLHIAINAVWISALLHGLTAAPWAKFYGARSAMQNPTPDNLELTKQGPS